MADKKITELPALTTAASSDVLYIIDDATGTPVSKKISLLNLLGAVPANTVFTAHTTFNNKVTAANGVITLATSTTPTSNNATTDLGAGMQGSVFWDQNYLYIATSNTEIKRVALNTF
jgi:hypothetical protein|tara:strand:- start:265 stop:618 length:354 start_codon:yes stop_codon:yes gene_type:complete